MNTPMFLEYKKARSIPIFFISLFLYPTQVENMKVISAVLFALGSFMVKSTVEGYHLMDNYPSRNCRSDIMDDDRPPICWRACFPEEPRCPSGWESDKMGHCWTCCFKGDDDYAFMKSKVHVTL